MWAQGCRLQQTLQARTACNKWLCECHAVQACMGYAFCIAGACQRRTGTWLAGQIHARAPSDSRQVACNTYRCCLSRRRPLRCVRWPGRWRAHGRWPAPLPWTRRRRTRWPRRHPPSRLGQWPRRWRWRRHSSAPMSGLQPRRWRRQRWRWRLRQRWQWPWRKRSPMPG